uniref:Helicase domain-containing protein n=1 Tax=uncultured marine group II/III euryarchaeote KM3_205_F07 TaxID=1456425 RepID=A0A075H0X3_9EURY|nr:helicase domain-containing protein [uncultured marine group II/III euryarchaeote KM3_205_F07]
MIIYKIRGDVLGSVDLVGEWGVSFQLDSLSSYRTVLYSIRVPLQQLRANIVENVSDLSFRIELSDFLYLYARNWRGFRGHAEISEELTERARQFFRDTRELDNPQEGWGEEQIRQCLINEYGSNRLPTDFQMRNLLQMLQRPVAATFSVPGSGKTSEAIAYWLCRRGEDERLLVALPKVGFLAWEEEFDQWIEWGRENVVRIEQSGAQLRQAFADNPDAKVFLITYQRLYRNVPELLDVMVDDDWSMILDESHNIKNYSGAYSNAVRRIGYRANCSRMILTGTPAPQGRMDLHAQCEFLLRGRIDLDRAVNFVQEIGVRTTKAELNLLTPREELVYGELPPAHRELYNILLGRISDSIGDLDTREQLRELRKYVVDLMRAASNPAVLCQIPEYVEVLPTEIVAEILSTPSWKVERTLELVNDLVTPTEEFPNGRKVIVWSYFNANTDVLGDRLRYLNPEIIRGDTPSATGDVSDSDSLEDGTREQILRDFKNRDDCRVIIANPAACGESISLHHWCHDAIYFDRSYNAGHYLQSQDRIHRFGTHPEREDYMTCREQVVTYHILITRNTIDTRIARRLEDKITNQEGLMRGAEFSQPLFENIGEPLEAGVSDSDIEDLLVNGLTEE